MSTSPIFKHLVLAVGILGLVILPQIETKPSQAAILNGDFETGDFTGWEVLGRASVITSVFTDGVDKGNYYTRLRNDADTEDTEIADSEIEFFLGLSSGKLDTLIQGNATQGSVIKQTVTAKVGEILSFDWNFLTNENTPSSAPHFNDFAFFSINDEVFKLADTFSSFRELTLSSSFSKETGFGTYSYTIPVDGTYTLGFGVLHEYDSAVSSGLVVDNIQLHSESREIPESTSVLGLSVLGILAVGSVFKPKQQQNQESV